MVAISAKLILFSRFYIFFVKIWNKYLAKTEANAVLRPSLKTPKVDRKNNWENATGFLNKAGSEIYSVHKGKWQLIIRQIQDFFVLPGNIFSLCTAVDPNLFCDTVSTSRNLPVINFIFHSPSCRQNVLIKLNDERCRPKWTKNV